MPCMDCGGSFPIICMDFDHVRGEKVGNVADLVKKNKPFDVILAEIAKCDVVCANCHRIRTAARYDAMRNSVTKFFLRAVWFVVMMALLVIGVGVFASIPVLVIWGQL